MYCLSENILSNHPAYAGGLEGVYPYIHIYPYIYGRLMFLVIEHFRPRDIQIAPDQYYVYYKVQQFDEYSLLYNWMSQWCKYLAWYYGTLCSDHCNLDQAFDGPMLIRIRKEVLSNRD